MKKAPPKGRAFFCGFLSLLLLFRCAIFAAFIEGRVERVEIFAVELIGCDAQTFTEALFW